MPVTVRGTDILFNDSTTQSTANNLPANTTNVLNATAGASAGAVGTYAFLSDVTNSSTDISAGTTVAGSSLRYASLAYVLCTASWISSASGTPSGTWRLVGYGSRASGNGSLRYASMWLRIS